MKIKKGILTFEKNGLFFSYLEMSQKVTGLIHVLPIMAKCIYWVYGHVAIV